MQALELIGVFAFAVSGALMAIRLDYDVVGIAVLAVVTALGGGIVRDLVLGDTPPPAFTRWEYLVVALAAAAVTSVAHPGLSRLSRPLLVFDAAGLGLFCVAGTEKALDHGLAPVAAACLGVTTAVGGGVLRDVIAREVPALVRADSELYAVPALVGALVIGVASTADVDHPAPAAGVAVAIFVVRVLALRRHWHGPRARRPRTPATRRGGRGRRRVPVRGAGSLPGRGRAPQGRGGTVIDDVIARWHRYMGGELPGGLDELLADDVVFYSPVVFTPQRGKAITTQYLAAASQALGGGGDATFRYTKEVLAGDTAVLEFETSVEGKYVNGVDIIRCDDAGRIVEFRVMIRPLQAIQAVHEQMGRRLATGG